MRTRCRFRRTEILELDLELSPGVVKEDITGHINLMFGNIFFRQDVIPDAADYAPEFETSTWELVSTADHVPAALEAPPGASIRLANSGAHLALAASVDGPTQVCGHCGGLGKDHRRGYQECTYCHGAGHVRTGKDEELSPGADCPDCGTTGIRVEMFGYGPKATKKEHRCARCDGTGRIPERGDLMHRPELPKALKIEAVHRDYKQLAPPPRGSVPNAGSGWPTELPARRLSVMGQGPTLDAAEENARAQARSFHLTGHCGATVPGQCAAGEDCPSRCWEYPESSVTVAPAPRVIDATEAHGLPKNDLRNAVPSDPVIIRGVVSDYAVCPDCITETACRKLRRCIQALGEAER